MLKNSLGYNLWMKICPVRIDAFQIETLQRISIFLLWGMKTFLQPRYENFHNPHTFRIHFQNVAIRAMHFFASGPEYANFFGQPAA